MMNRDKQIALMRIASERVESPLKAWVTREKVMHITAMDPDMIAREANDGGNSNDIGGTMMLACA